MEFNQLDISIISIDDARRQEIFFHCRRKIEGRYLDGETPDKKAFGLLGGVVEGGRLCVRRVIPLRRNARSAASYKSYMDGTMDRHAVPSETPLPERGWVAEQAELDAALVRLHGEGLRLVGTYHMHRVPWDHDPIRDTPTELDSILGRDSRLFMFIVSMVDPSRPRLRAFFEGDPARELGIEVREDAS